MKLANSLHISLFPSSMPVGDRCVHVFITAGECLSGGAIITIAQAREMVAEFTKAIDKTERAQDASLASAIRFEDIAVELGLKEPAALIGEANARLIAAAPALHVALKDLRAWIPQLVADGMLRINDRGHERLARADAALKAATGD